MANFYVIAHNAFCSTLTKGKTYYAEEYKLDYLKIWDSNNEFKGVFLRNRFKKADNKLNDHMPPKDYINPENIEPVYNYVDARTYELNISKDRVKYLMEKGSGRTELERKIYKTHVKDGSIVTEDITDQIKTETTYTIP